MLELVREYKPRTAPWVTRIEADAWDLDEPHQAMWDAVRHLFPAHAMVNQVDHDLLLVSWSLRDGRHACSHFSAPVLIRIGSGLLVALGTCERQERRRIAALQLETVQEALFDYDAHSRVPTCGVITLGE